MRMQGASSGTATPIDVLAPWPSWGHLGRGQFPLQTGWSGGRAAGGWARQQSESILGEAFGGYALQRVPCGQSHRT